MPFMNLAGHEAGYDQLQPLITTMNGGGGSWLNLTGIDDDSNPGVRIKNGNSGGAFSVLATDDSNLIDADDSGVTIPTLAVTTLTATTGNITTLNSTTGNIGTANVSTLLSVTGNAALGNENTDTLTVIGSSTYRNAANTATQLFVDAGNNRVIVGSATTLGSDTAPNLQVIGRLYVAPESANDTAIQVRRSSAATVGWSAGVESTNDLVFKDDSDTAVVRFGDNTSATWQLQVITGDARIQDLLSVGGALVVGATALSGSEELRVVGQTRLEGALTVTTGGIGVTGSSAFNDGLTVLNGFTLSTGSFSTANVNHGFFGSTPIARPTVSGSRGGNAALADLLSELANLGLITDSTTA